MGVNPIISRRLKVSTGTPQKLFLAALLNLALGLFVGTAHAEITQNGEWFETLKDNASPEELHKFLYAMPKGGDLHHHLTGAIHPEWFQEIAAAQKERGYTYFVKTKINNCEFGSNEFGPNAYLLLFRTVQESTFNALDDCVKSEYKPLAELDERELDAWKKSQYLDKPYEGRSEFFEAHWSRIGEMVANPYLVAEAIYYNMRSFGAEGLLYLEAQVPVTNYVKPDGSPFPVDEVMDIFRQRINASDARATGVTVRFQWAILRFLANADDDLRAGFEFVSKTPEYVGLNMVGREDNDKGYPLRFLKTLRELRHSYSNVRLAIHAGEVDEPNQHVRETLLLGADRIGHGVNLITDPDTMLLMRHGPYMVEINLISNLLLEYVSDYSQHPFPEYLRTGIPVALSTDDRGMWDSTLTDEFFVAVTEFDLSWREVRELSTNSIAYSFVEEDVKDELLNKLNKRLDAFEKRFRPPLTAKQGFSRLKVTPEHRGFLCRRYSVCDPSAVSTQRQTQQ